MCISGFYFHTMMAGAGGDEKVVRWHALASFPTPIRQFARQLPHFIIDRQLRNPLLVIQQCCAFPFAAHARP